MSSKKKHEKRSDGAAAEKGHLLTEITPSWWQGRAGLVVPLLLLVGVFCFLRFHVFAYYIDENDVPSYLFQADVFGLGKLKVPIPAPDHPDQRRSNDAPQFFRTFMVVPHTFDDRKPDGTKYRYMFSRYPPGHPLVLCAGKMLLRSYRLVPLLLLLLIAGAVYAVLRLTEGETAARWGLLLVPLSPLLMTFGSSLLSHNSTLLFILAGTLGYVLMDRAASLRGRMLWGFAAAFAYGMAFACRPLNGLCAMIAVALWELARLRSNRKGILLRWLPMALGGLLVLAGVLWYNAQLTGQPLRLPFTAYWPRDTLGFTGWFEKDTEAWTSGQKERQRDEFLGEDVLGHTEFRYQQHTPLLGLRNVLVQTGLFNDFFLAVPCGLVLLILLLIRFRRSLSPYWRLYALMMAVMMGSMFFYFSRGEHYWGPRYYYEVLGPALLLMASVLPVALAEVRLTPRTWRRLGLLAGLILVWHTYSVCYEAYSKQGKLCRFRARMARDIQAKVQTPAIVFLPMPFNYLNAEYWYVGFRHTHLLNSPTFDDPILYAVNNGPSNHVLTDLPKYRDRNRYVLTHHGQVVPLPRTAPPPRRPQASFPPATWRNGLGMAFMRIPAGVFPMGSLSGELGATRNEQPLHWVQLTQDFLMAKYEVTRAQFGAFVAATEYNTTAERVGSYVGVGRHWVWRDHVSWRNPGFAQQDDHPVVCVSYEDAQAYVHWLNAKDSAKPEGWVYRLPTEAEWEYAARGSTWQRFPWGAHWQPGQCNSSELRRLATVPVGSFSQKSPFGVYDLAGNVWEWCVDAYDDLYYMQCPAEDPVYAGPSQYRVYRGGSWADGQAQCRVAARGIHLPGNRRPIVGLRVVLVPAGSTEL